MCAAACYHFVPGPGDGVAEAAFVKNPAVFAKCPDRAVRQV